MQAVFSKVKISGKSIAGLVVFVLIASIGQMMTPTLLAGMIDTGVNSQNEQLIISIAIAMIILSVIVFVTNALSARISAKVATKFSADLREEMFKKVQDFSAAEIDKFGTASLITRSTTDVTTIQTFMSMAFRFGILAPMMTAVGLILSIVTAGELSILLAIAIPILAVVATALIVDRKSVV